MATQTSQLDRVEGGSGVEQVLAVVAAERTRQGAVSSERAAGMP